MEASGSDADDRQDFFKPSEVIDVARVEREAGGEGSGGDQQIDGSGATCLAARRDDCGIHASIGPRRVAIERQRVKVGFGPLQAILAPCSLTGIDRRVRAGGELCHGQGADGEFDGELRGVDVIQIDDDRGVDEALQWPWSLRHEG